MSAYPLIDIEQALVAHLAATFLTPFPGVVVESAPGDPDDYSARAIDGAVIVRFAAMIPERPPDVPAPIARVRYRIQFIVFVGVSGKSAENPHHQALRYLETARLALTGFSPTLEGGRELTFYPGGSANEFDEKNTVWWYRLLVESTPIVL